MFNTGRKRLIRVDDYIYEISQDDYHDILALKTIISSNEKGSIAYYNADIGLREIKQALNSIRPKYIVDVDLSNF